MAASEAAAASGQHKYLTRNQMLTQKHSGITPEVDAAKQQLFDRGHAAEASARAIAEEIIGEDLFPVTGTIEIDGLKLLASLDGQTLDEEIIFEHKLASEELLQAVRDGSLHPHYTIQMDQQLLVSGARKCLFMVSDGTRDNMAWLWYESSQEKFDALIAAWKQFHADLATYQPRETVEKPAAAPIMQLPALAVQIRGEVTSSNLPAFRAAAEQFIAGINTDLKTDEDFAQAEANVKFCGEAEKSLELAKAAAIAQTASIDDLMRTLDHIREQLRVKRLSLEKLVTAKKDAIKAEILATARLMFTDHVRALESEIEPIIMSIPMPDFAGAAKSKRTLNTRWICLEGQMAKALKAYEVHDGDDGWCITFANNSATARREGANKLDTEWECIEHCRRRPTLDQYAPGPVPPMALIDLGWWFECYHCGRRVDNDLAQSVENDDLDPDDFEVVTDGQRVYCSHRCQASEYADERARVAANAALIELFESLYPGCRILHINISGKKLESVEKTHYPRCSVSFNFPGGKYSASWNFGDSNVWVAQDDVDAFKVYKQIHMQKDANG